MIGLTVALIGMFMLQDGLASIAFYPQEKWCWNHIARVVRSGFGLILIVLGGVLIGN